MSGSRKWWLYVVECNDDKGSLYTGISTDVERRVWEHNHSNKGARYTRTRRPVKLLVTWPYPDRSAATKAENRFKRLSRKAKLRRVARKLELS